MSNGAWALVLVVAAVATPLVDAWLLRHGRISPTVAAALLAGRFPVFVALIWLLMGNDPLMLVLVEIPLVAMARWLFYPALVPWMTDLAPAPVTRSGGPRA